MYLIPGKEHLHGVSTDLLDNDRPQIAWLLIFHEVRSVHCPKAARRQLLSQTDIILANLLDLSSAPQPMLHTVQFGH